MRVMPSRVVLACIAAAMAIPLAACMSAPAREASSAPASTVDKADERGQISRVGVRTRDGGIIFNYGDYHCAHPSHKLFATYGGCDAVPAVILFKPTTGECYGLLPYANLWIHSDRQRTKVVWEINGAPGYRFAVNDGIQIDKLPTNPTLPSQNYDQKQHQGRKFKWELRDDALSPRTFYHLPNIVDPNGKACIPIDPGMINVVD